MNRRVMSAVGAASVLMMSAGALPARGQSSEVKERIMKALPDKAYAKPAQPRRLLVFTATRGYRHESIPVGVEALRQLGAKTAAFEVVHSEDTAAFEPKALKSIDAVLMLSSTGEILQQAEPFDGNTRTKSEHPALREKRLRESLLDFVNDGGGLVGIHAATDCSYQWKEYGEMIGGYFDGHPWHEAVVIKLDQPQSPLCAMFEGKPLEITDEIYQFREPYSRKRCDVLMSLDTARTDMKKEGIKRSDGDFPVSWIRTQGKGRVFYCSLGHRDEIFWNPAVLRHYLAGIQYALGDLKLDAKADAAPGGGATPSDDESGAGETPLARRAGGPSAAAEPGVFLQKQPGAGWVALLNGKDLAGWKGLVAPEGGPPARAKMSPAELAKAQAEADQRMREHWKVEDGVLVFDGGGDSLVSEKEYGDFELEVEWKIAAGGDSGIYLRGAPQVQIWDPAQWPEGSGGLYNNQLHPSKPLLRADRPAGEWNKFWIRLIGDRVSVKLNDMLVVDDVPLENYWERGKPLYPRGSIELQSHKTPLSFRNIRVREIDAAEAAKAPACQAWQMLCNGKDTSGWTCKEGSWAIEDGALARKGGGDIWSKEQFGDFTLELEFKLDPQTNSGIFFRTGDPADCVQTGIELQVLDSFGKEKPDAHDCGAVYDCLPPARNVARKPGEWNHVVLICRGPRILANMNGEPIIDMNLDDWKEAGKNPDGSPNKFRMAYKDMPRKGYIGFQDHGKPVWYRNIRIRPE